MSESFPSISPFKGQSWILWTTLLENKNILNDKSDQEENNSVQLLPRHDLPLFREIPASELRVISLCNTCNVPVNPQAFSAHASRFHSKELCGDYLTSSSHRSTSHNIKKKNPHSKSKKKSTIQPHVPPPPLFPKTQPPSPSTATTSQNQSSVELLPPVLQPVDVDQTSSPSSSSLSSSTSRHKKSRKSSKSTREYDPDKHCGVVEGNKGPCLRSLTCSTHAIQLRRVVTGRAKDFDELLTQHKISKEKEKDPRPVSVVPIKILERKPVPLVATTIDILTPITTSLANIKSIPVSYTKTTHTVTLTTTTSCPSPIISIPTADSPKLKKSYNTDSGYNAFQLQESINSQEMTVDCSSSVVFMPMSPVSVVSPVQLIKLETTPSLQLASPQPAPSPPLPNQPILVTIPDHCTSFTLYNSHPKPLAMATGGIRRVGGSLLLHNPHLERQRYDIQLAINTKRQAINSLTNYKPVSLLNTHHHRPNILKNATRTNAAKRPASDKLSTECKQIRLAPDVNGFILHADVSEAAEAPQSNNSIHEKITLLNIK